MLSRHFIFFYMEDRQSIYLNICDKYKDLIKEIKINRNNLGIELFQPLPNAEISSLVNDLMYEKGILRSLCNVDSVTGNVDFFVFDYRSRKVVDCDSPPNNMFFKPNLIWKDFKHFLVLFTMWSGFLLSSCFIIKTFFSFPL